MPPPSSRMTKNRAQPTRYRPGKAETADVESEEESSEEEDEGRAKAPPQKATSFPSHKKLAIDLSKAEQQISIPAQQQARKPDEDLEGFVTASESSSAEDDDEDKSGSSGEEVEESSEEESSSDEEPKKPMLAPKFISKSQRNNLPGTTNTSTQEKAAELELQRKEKADALLQVQLERDRASRAAGKKNWDDDDNIPAEEEVHDTDALDPEAELAAWKLRELKRVRRDRLAIEEKEREREEVERRRNMTAEEREVEDREYIAAQQGEREGKGKMGYMQKYFHKGAFFGADGGEADEEVKTALTRSFAGAKFEDETGDKAVLPEYMRMRDMTRLGKKGRTKYRDLKSEDTGRWGVDVGRKRRDDGGDGLDERFRPDDHYGGGGGGGVEQTGANRTVVGERRPRIDGDGRDSGSGRGEKRVRYE